MGKKSKFVQVCVEGATTDGREISRQDIQDMADTYDPKLYNARVNLEHYRGIMPNGPFKAYGDVTGVKAEEIQDGPLQGRLALRAQIDATDDLVEMNRARQKVHSSIEFHPNFAKTGKAYLTGLAVTDSPASLGTEIMQFSSTAAVNPLAHRKSDPACLFTAAEEVTFEFEDIPDNKPSLLTKVKEMFASRDKAGSSQMDDVHLAVTEIAEHQQQQDEKFGQLTELATTVTQLNEQVTAQQTELTALKQKLSSTDASQSFRPEATGAQAEHITDC
ncbi:Phage capsid scaffolding protein (GPO) serine peptidase [Serratia quinivorans]|uniref:GPO family capsid scaffolding protein n=1 Tax=Serratia quinivorans TaxID=137545 RepID=UPI00217C168E|nr:GPO family capsid scaffolding protein [Serratia quinivorans]CAI1857504.1 Phage capsid scaffolding protein (GPO) serine peptidase [Serratia quinivorans]